MAGSAGSPPERIDVAFPKGHHHESFAVVSMSKRYSEHLRAEEELDVFEYVPRESDALFAALNEVVEMTGLLLPARGEDAALDAMGDRVAGALDSYRGHYWGG